MLNILDAEQMDRHLSSGPFGNSEHLAANVALLYEQIARIVGQEMGIKLPSPSDSAHPPLKAMIRRELDFSFAELAEGRTISNQHRWTDVIDFLGSHTLTFKHEVVGPILVLADWSQDGTAENIRQAFRESMLSEGSSIKGRRPVQQHIKVIERAHELAKEIMPRTYFGTLSLAPNMVLVRGEVSSAYINENPFSFFVNESQLTDPILAMETLLHEALHEKMTCIRLTSNLLLSGYDDADSESRGDVLVPWPDVARPRYWSFARALAAYHVYVHTSALYLQLLANPMASMILTKDELRNRLRTQYERAQYLQFALRAEWCLPFADVDAIQFFEWTEEVLDAIFALKDAVVPTMQTWSYADVRAAEDSRRAA